MKRLIGCAALLCLAALMSGCGGSASSTTTAYVSNSTGTGFTVFTVNTNGTLAPSNVSPITTPAPPTMLQISPNGRWAYFPATDPSTNSTFIYAFTRSGNGALPTFIDKFPVSGGASSLAISPNSQFLYAALPNALNGELAIYSIDQSTGILTQIGSNILINYQITQLAMSPAGDVLYGLAPNQQAAVTFTLSSTTGLATGPNAFAVGPTPATNGMILSANGSFLYVVDRTQTGPFTNVATGQLGQSPDIYGFATSSTGILSRMAGSPFHENADLVTQLFPVEPVAGATSSDSRFLFVANQGSHNISAFRIASVGGELSEVLGSVSTVGGVQVSTASPFDCGTGCSTPSFIAVAKSNNAIYVLNEGQFASPQTASAIFQFNSDQNTGRLRPLSPASVALGVGTSPTWITIR